MDKTCRRNDSLRMLVAIVGTGTLLACSAEVEPTSASEDLGSSRVTLRSPEEAGLPAFERPAAANSDGQVGVTVQAIVNGDLLDPSISQGVPTLWGFSHASQEWKQMCSSVLLSNEFLLSAVHCFTSPDFRDDAFVVTHGNEARFILDHVSAPDSLDVMLAIVNAPFTVRGSTTGYARSGTNGSAGRSVYSVGTGLPVEGQTGPASNLCRSGSQGCEADPRSLRISVHTTQWDGSDHRAATGTELFVTANDRGQWPTYGDSGGPLLEIANGGDLLDQPLMGILARMTLEDGVWHNFYTPLQHYWPWLCSAFGC